MAFSPPNARKVKFERDQELRKIRADRAAAIQAENDEKKRREQVRSCYHEYSPPQIAQAGEMIQAARFCAVTQDGIWKRIGRSNGGKKKANLYVCRSLAEVA